MIKQILITTLTLTTLTVYADQMPLSAEAGQCFTKTFYPPKFTTETKIKSTKKVLLNSASVKYDVVPAKFSWHEERIKINEGKEKIVSIPAVYKVVSKRILVEPSKTIWKTSLNSSAPRAFQSCIQSALNAGMNTSDARVGTCYYEHYQPERYTTTTSNILVAEASERIMVTPATYRKVKKKVITDSTSVKLIPSVAVYKKVKDKVVIAPARTEWKKTTCENRGCNESEVVCLTEFPVTYKKVIKKIVLEPAVQRRSSVTPVFKIVEIEEQLTPARSKSIKIPARYQTLAKKEKSSESRYFWSGFSGKNASTRLTTECNRICLTQTADKYKDIKKKIVVTPATSRLVSTPAQYKMVKIKKITQEASFKKVVIPAEYISIVSQQNRTKGFAKWMPMVCEANMSQSMIRKVQQALQFQGFYHGVVDGVWNLESKQATRAYQKANGLSVTTKLSIEAMMALGVQ